MASRDYVGDRYLLAKGNRDRQWRKFRGILTEPTRSDLASGESRLCWRPVLAGQRDSRPPVAKFRGILTEPTRSDLASGESRLCWRPVCLSDDSATASGESRLCWRPVLAGQRDTRPPVAEISRNFNRANKERSRQWRVATMLATGTCLSDDSATASGGSTCHSGPVP